MRIFLLLCLFPSLLFAQSKTDLAKIAPKLQSILAADFPQHFKSGSPFSLFHKNTQEPLLVFVSSENPQALATDGFAVQSIFNRFSTVLVKPQDILNLSKRPDVLSISLGGRSELLNDHAAAVIGATELQQGLLNNTVYKGAGVVVCVIDTGLDYKHLDFRNPSNPLQSRVKYIWDQTLTKTGAETTPFDRDPTFPNYGVEYNQTQLENEIDGSPAGFVRQEDIAGHGTHVTGTAAGNGSAYALHAYTGMAPEADIVHVKYTGDDAQNADALSYCNKIGTTLGKPVVVNGSWGGHYGGHDGTSFIEDAVDTFSSSGTATGRLIAFAGGNSADNILHKTGTIPAMGSVNVQIVLPAYTAGAGSDNDFTASGIWVDTNGNADIDITYTTPSGANSISQTTNGWNQTNTPEGTLYAEVTHESTTSNDLRLEAWAYDAVATAPPASGTWTITLTNNTSSAYTYHHWLILESLRGQLLSVVGGDNLYSLAIPSTANHALSIGAFTNRYRWRDNGGTFRTAIGLETGDDIAEFSSIGPTTDGRQKPDISTPGKSLISSLSSTTSQSTAKIAPGALHFAERGTSMASPVAAGAMALLLQQNPNLTQTQVKTLLQNTANCDKYVAPDCTTFTGDNTWGKGKLDIFEAMTKLIDNTAIAQRSIPLLDEWASNSYISLNANEKIAVKFTPTFTGKMTGAMIHPRTVGATGNISVEIWSDNGSGLPATKLGNTVTTAANLWLEGAWNYIPMYNSTVNVSNGTNYHLVLYFSTGASTEIMIDNAIGKKDGTGNSSINTGGGFIQDVNNDYRLRPIFAGTTLSGALPIQFTTFASKIEDQKLTLDWQTATQENLTHFNIEACYYQSNCTRIGQIFPNVEMKYTFTSNILKAGLYQFKLVAHYKDGKEIEAQTFQYQIEMPNGYQITKAYPNPLQQAAQIEIALENEQNVQVTLVDMLGRTVEQIYDGALSANTLHRIQIVAPTLSNGVYFIQIKGETFQDLQKITILKP